MQSASGTTPMADPQDYPFMGPAWLDFSTSSMPDEYSNDPRYVESQRELRTLLFDTARSSGPTRVGSPVPHDSSAGNAEFGGHNTDDGESMSFTKRIVSDGKRITWLRNYIDEVAPWLDMFDAQQFFGVEVPILAKTSPSLTYAILAISARQMERQKMLKGGQDSLQLYQEAITSLTPQLQTRDPKIMATCVILCCLEMMSAAPKSWRNHLDGCAALFDAYNINGFSSGLPQAVFWCYARMDLCAAIISEGEQSTVLAIDRWLPPNTDTSQVESLFSSSGIPDMYANYAVWLCARVCHLAYSRRNSQTESPGTLEAEPFIHSWNILWAELHKWKENRPVELIEINSVKYSGQSEMSPFPFILYGANCAISSNQLYHTGCLLLLDMKPRQINTREMGQLGSSIWHARRSCGISITNAHHGCLNNAIQPLWIAGKFLSHPAEHKSIIDLLKRVEKLTGWSSKWRVEDLRNLWGYDKSDSLF